MRRFDRIDLVTDARFAEQAVALRGLLEVFFVRVNYLRFVERDELVAYFGSPNSAPLTILASHGGLEKREPALRFESRVENSEGRWSIVDFCLTPSSIPETVHGWTGNVLSLACGGGHPSLAKAFLQAGVSGYIGTSSAGVDMDAALLFATTFVYFLLSEDREGCVVTYSVAEAAKLAAAIDDWEWGTGPFVYYGARS